MDFLEEHNYGVVPRIKSEPERSALNIELNIKMECESLSEHNYSLHDATVTITDKENNEPETETAESRINVTTKKNLKSEESDSDDSILATSSKRHLSDLQKAYILQTCMSLLDSSSSDDDELMLLWLLCRNKKKRFRKRRKI